MGAPIAKRPRQRALRIGGGADPLSAATAAERRGLAVLEAIAARCELLGVPDATLSEVLRPWLAPDPHGPRRRLLRAGSASQPGSSFPNTRTGLPDKAPTPIWVSSPSRNSSRTPTTRPRALSQIGITQLSA